MLLIELVRQMLPDDSSPTTSLSIEEVEADTIVPMQETGMREKMKIPSCF